MRHECNFKCVFRQLHDLYFKSTFFEIFSHSTGAFGTVLLENFSKNVDFSHWGKQCIVLPKWTLFPCFILLCFIWKSTKKWTIAVAMFFTSETFLFTVLLPWTSVHFEGRKNNQFLKGSKNLYRVNISKFQNIVCRCSFCF